MYVVGNEKSQWRFGFCEYLQSLLLLLRGGVTVKASDLRSGGRGFDSQSGHYQAT